MSVKLFVTDLDGTLLPSGKDVPRENIEAVQEAVRAGVIVTIATGRMYRAALPVAEALGVDVTVATVDGSRGMRGFVTDAGQGLPHELLEA